MMTSNEDKGLEYIVTKAGGVVNVMKNVNMENTKKPPCTITRKNEPNIELMAKAFINL